MVARLRRDPDDEADMARQFLALWREDPSPSLSQLCSRLALVNKTSRTRVRSMVERHCARIGKSVEEFETAGKNTATVF